MRKLQVYLLVTLFAIFSLASGTAAQTVQGVITGTITDPSGASVPNATVTITNVGTGASQTTTTGLDGSYRFSLVPPGQYVVDIKATNFAGVKASGIVVEASQTVPYSVKLELAKGSEIIEVTEQTVLVQTATSDLSTQVDRETILNAPLADRDVFSTLPFLAPSVTPGIDLMPTSGGARESGTAYLLNGGDDNDNFSEGAINVHPPLESVQDFSIKTNAMSAEYGRGAGAVVSANQVSGTNKFHGAIYEFNRNASLNAEDFFSNRDGLKKPKYIRNQFGGIISGPIHKDKTFFSFAYDRFKIQAGSAAANQVVPTAEGLANLMANANGNGTGAPSIAKAILSVYVPRTSEAECPGNLTKTGGPGQPDNNGGIDTNTGLPWAAGCLSFFDPQTDTNNIYYGRVDHNFSANDRISVTANIFRESFVDQFGGAPLNTTLPTAGVTTNHYHQISLNETHIFNPRLVNELTVAHNRHFNVFIAGNGKTTVPNITIDNQSAGGSGFNLGGPADGSQVQGFTQDRWGASDGLNWTKGHHSLKFGGGFQYGILYRNWDLGLPGFYEFGNLDSVNGVCGSAAGCTQVTPVSDGTLNPVDGTISGVASSTAPSNFTNDYPYFEETSINPANGAKGIAYRHYTYRDDYLFVQDDWKVSARLTVNLGLRWDRYGAPGEAHGIMAQFNNLGCDIGNPDVAAARACIGSLRVGPVSRMWPTYNKDFAPRVGFAWDPTGKGKMAVRAGYGIFYDRIFDNIWSNGAWNPPFYDLIDFGAAGCGDAIFYSNPATIGGAYDPSNPIPHPGKRVSVRTMDQSMHDSSGENYYFGVERQVAGGLLLRANYQGSFGRHLPMLENYNRTDGEAYNLADSNRRPNSLYTGFNYRSNSVSSSYNSLVLEAQKRMSRGLEFQTSYTWSKLLDVNSDLFAGCSTIGGQTAPYYYLSNNRPGLSRGPASYDHKSAYKFSVTYELPFMKTEKGVVGHALGGWSIGSFMQLYTGHPIDVYSGRSRFQAFDAAGNAYLDQNGIPFNIGGDYNLDNVLNDHPDYLGGSISAAYSGKNPADGIFKDNSLIGCGFPGAVAAGVAQAAIDNCNATFGVTGSGNTLFGNAAYPSGSTPYERFGTLGRNVFRGPKFVQLDLGLSKSFKLTETMKLDFRAQAQNVLNHPNFDCITSNLDSSTFGQAQCLTPFGLGAPIARVMSLGLRIAF
jgi:carboxypeptidase family protein/TonB-dependent receptor-like protein